VAAGYQAAVTIAAWCALRFGELAELRRKDIDTDAGVIRVRRGVVHIDREPVIGTPKTTAGVRDVAVPPHVLPAVEKHLADHVDDDAEALLFTGGAGQHLPEETLRHHWHRARALAGRPDLTWHALRHTGATLAAASGATVSELMARLGHTTAGAAMVYQHAAAERDKAVAARMSELAAGSQA